MRPCVICWVIFLSMVLAFQSTGAGIFIAKGVECKNAIKVYSRFSLRMRRVSEAKNCKFFAFLMVWNGKKTI